MTVSKMVKKLESSNAEFKTYHFTILDPIEDMINWPKNMWFYSITTIRLRIGQNIFTEKTDLLNEQNSFVSGNESHVTKYYLLLGQNILC